MPATTKKTIDDILASVSVTRETLEETPDRALKLLRGIGTSRVIRAMLMDVGYTTQLHVRAWRNLRFACGNGDDDTPLELEDPKVRAAVTFVDTRDEWFFRILAAVWKHSFPEQLAFVLKGNLGPSTGMQSVLNMGIALDRLDVLEKGPERKATRKEDTAALALLAERKIDGPFRTMMRNHVNVAQDVTPVTMGEVTPSTDPDIARLEALVELRKFYEEWSEIAKVTIKRRDHLIRMGLASRRAPAKPEPTDPEV
jgi:hypothetical protein